MVETAKLIAFALSFVAIAVLLALAVRQLTSRRFQFWPPPVEGGWQHATFAWLFRGFFYSLVALSLLEFRWPEESRDVWQSLAGVILLVVGFALALRITFSMGWRNAFGEKRGVVTTGWFGLSRHPVYVASWVGQLGWALLVASWLVSLLLLAWAMLYLVAPYLEEPWLEEQYGDAYRRYQERVPRFFAWPRSRQSPRS